MAEDELLQYLEEKLRYLMKELERPDISAKLTKISSKFRQLADKLKQRRTSASVNASITSREMLYDLFNRLNEWQLMKSKNQPTQCSIEWLFFTWKFSGRLDRFITELDKPPAGKTEAIQTSLSVAPTKEAKLDELQQIDNKPPAGNPEAIQTSSLVDGTKVAKLKLHGFEHNIMSIQRFVVPRKKEEDRVFKVIGIVGMRGVGKTALCQSIFDMPEVKDHFHPRIWVCLSKKPQEGDKEKEEEKDERKVTVRRMLAQLKVDQHIVSRADESDGLKGLLFALRRELLRTPYLIVLDDFSCGDQKYRDFCCFIGGGGSGSEDSKCEEKLSYGLPKGFGGRVVVTSRAEEVTKAMVGEGNLHRLLPLSDDDSCWNIFKDSAEKDGKPLPPDLEKFKDEIVKVCAGLPLAAKVMGQIAETL